MHFFVAQKDLARPAKISAFAGSLDTKLMAPVRFVVLLAVVAAVAAHGMMTQVIPCRPLRCLHPHALIAPPLPLLPAARRPQQLQQLQLVLSALHERRVCLLFRNRARVLL
jgi:hypothetical protein